MFSTYEEDGFTYSRCNHLRRRLMDEKDRLRAAKLDQLRQEIREGLSSGPATAWDPEEIKRKGRAKRATKTGTAKA